MKIGTKVSVNFVAVPSYDNFKRRWIRKKPTVQEGWYVGYTFKKEGIYTPGGWENSPEYLNAHLSDIKSVKLFRVKFSERSNDSFVYPEDLEEIK